MILQFIKNKTKFKRKVKIKLIKLLNNTIYKQKLYNNNSKNREIEKMLYRSRSNTLKV